MAYVKKSMMWAALLTILFSVLTPLAFAAEAAGGASGERVFNMAIAYGITSAAALLLAGGYAGLVRKKNPWLLLLFISVVVVNLGYFSLAISKTLAEALLANRVSYLGSVFLPLCMLMTIMDVCRIRYRKRVPVVLLCISVAVFILAASPGYLDCYYSEVSLVFINGMAKLEKVYGPLHSAYLIYLLGYFGLMICVIWTSFVKKTVVSLKHAILLLTVVLLNIAIWGVEQMIYTQFELLSVSYIVSELLLVMLYGMMQDYGILSEDDAKPAAETLQKATAIETDNQKAFTDEVEGETEETNQQTALSAEQIKVFVDRWSADYALTGREAEVLVALLEDKKRKDIAAEMSVTEHTIKKHTGNVFSKLGVSNRVELFGKVDSEIKIEL